MTYTEIKLCFHKGILSITDIKLKERMNERNRVTPSQADRRHQSWGHQQSPEVLVSAFYTSLLLSHLVPGQL